MMPCWSLWRPQVEEPATLNKERSIVSLILGLTMNRSICADGDISQGMVEEGGIGLAGSQKPLP